MLTTSTECPRVLHLIDTGGPGGAETVFHALATFGRAAGINAAVVIPYHGWLGSRLQGDGVTPIIVAAKKARGPKLLKEIVRVARQSRANILHAHLLGSGVYGAAAGSYLGIPVVVTVHGETDFREPGSLLLAKRWLLRRRNVRVVAVSEAVKNAVTEWDPALRHVAVINNGVDTELFLPGKSFATHDAAGIDHRCQLVGAVGNVRPAKSYDVLIRSAAYVLRNRPDVHFVIVGEGSDEELSELRQLSRSIGVGDRTHMLGFRPASADLYRSLAVMASSAQTEGQPLSFLEAMACEIPIAATANEGASKLLGEAGSGLLSPVGDARMLAESILQLLSDPLLATQLGQSGRKTVLRSYSLARMTDDYRALYDTLLQDQSACL
jgi:glycosyltransferase involved in cell wall biosynthesis